jgi:hypothetical protein
LFWGVGGMGEKRREEKRREELFAAAAKSVSDQ